VGKKDFLLQNNIYLTCLQDTIFGGHLRGQFSSKRLARENCRRVVRSTSLMLTSCANIN
jgi:hypothetical protein